MIGSLSFLVGDWSPQTRLSNVTFRGYRGFLDKQLLLNVYKRNKFLSLWSYAGKSCKDSIIRFNYVCNHRFCDQMFRKCVTEQDAPPSLVGAVWGETSRSSRVNIIYQLAFWPKSARVPTLSIPQTASLSSTFTETCCASRLPRVAPGGGTYDVSSHEWARDNFTSARCLLANHWNQTSIILILWSKDYASYYRYQTT